MFAISCSQKDTLNNDTDNVNICIWGDLSLTASCVAVFIYIQMCPQIQANVKNRWMTQLNLLSLSSWCNSLQIQTPRSRMRASANTKLGGKRHSHIHWEQASCAASLTPASSWLLHHVSILVNISLHFGLSPDEWFLCVVRGASASHCVLLDWGLWREQSQRHEQSRAPTLLSKLPLTIWWHLDKLFVSSALFNLI